MRKCVILALFVAALCAQVPTVGRRGRTAPRQQNRVSDLETPVATFHGKLKSLTKKEVVLELGEDKSIAFHISHKTKFLKDAKPIKPAAIPAGAPVTIDGKRDLLGNVDAVTVTVDTGPQPNPPNTAP